MMREELGTTQETTTTVQRTYKVGVVYRFSIRVMATPTESQGKGQGCS